MTTDRTDIELYTLRQLAKLQGHSYFTLRAWKRAGFLEETAKFGTRSKYTLHDLKLAIERSKVGGMTIDDIFLKHCNI